MRLFLLICGGLFFSTCYSQNKSSSPDSCLIMDQEISDLHTEMYNQRHESLAKKEAAIVNFRDALKSHLSSQESTNCTLDSLGEKISIIGQAEDELRIFSWDEFDGGTWHIYNSLYQYVQDEKIYTGTMVLEDVDNKMTFTDVIYFEINKLEENLFLVQGYGTHGHGHDFFTMRLLSLVDGQLTDCDQCFDGKDRLVLYKARIDDYIIAFNKETHEITYPLLIEDEENGFMISSGKNVLLKWQKGVFMP